MIGLALQRPEQTLHAQKNYTIICIAILRRQRKKVIILKIVILGQLLFLSNFTYILLLHLKSNNALFLFDSHSKKRAYFSTFHYKTDFSETTDKMIELNGKEYSEEYLLKAVIFFKALQDGSIESQIKEGLKK